MAISEGSPDVLESSFSSSLIISPQATGSDFQHSPSEIDDGSDHWQSPIQVFHVAAASSSRTEDLALCICKICEEYKWKNEIIRVNKTCFHSFCSNCVSKHVETRITGNQVIVPCPELDCEHSVEIESCLGFVPKDVLEAWDRAFCESSILDAYKFYCPFRDCSAMLENDSKMVVVESECPYCHRLFCAQCQVPWHAGWSCEEFRALSEDERGNEDFMLRKLAAEKKWGRCPKCKFYVERTDGCPHITCADTSSAMDANHSGVKAMEVAAGAKRVWPRSNSGYKEHGQICGELLIQGVTCLSFAGLLLSTSFRTVTYECCE